MKLYRRAALALPLLTMLAGCAVFAQPPAEHKTQHILFVMTDGLRWQEVFDGAEASLMNKKNGKVTNEAPLKKDYWRETPEARREALLPFLWTVMAKQGQIFGNREKGSDAYVTNGRASRATTRCRIQMSRYSNG